MYIYLSENALIQKGSLSFPFISFLLTNLLDLCDYSLTKNKALRECDTGTDILWKYAKESENKDISLLKRASPYYS